LQSPTLPRRRKGKLISFSRLHPFFPPLNYTRDSMSLIERK
jgi:hypothetical protein